MRALDDQPRQEGLFQDQGSQWSQEQQNSAGSQPQLWQTWIWTHWTTLQSSQGWHATHNDEVAVEALGSTGDYDRDSAMGISENDTEQGGDESDSDCESW